MTEQPNLSSENRHLQLLAHQLKQDPDYMASVLSRYQISERLDDQSLSEYLLISQPQVTRLALCKRPRSSDRTFADQVRQLAAYCGTDVSRLAAIIRQVDALSAFGGLPNTDELKAELSVAGLSSLGWLAAARDRDADEDEKEVSENNKPEAQDE